MQYNNIIFSKLAYLCGWAHYHVCQYNVLSYKYATNALMQRSFSPKLLKIIYNLFCQSTKLETERKHIRDMLSERRSELTKAEEQMYKACGTATYEATLAKVTAAVDKLQVKDTSNF